MSDLGPEDDLYEEMALALQGVVAWYSRYGGAEAWADGREPCGLVMGPIFEALRRAREADHELDELDLPELESPFEAPPPHLSGVDLVTIPTQAFKEILTEQSADDVDRMLAAVEDLLDNLSRREQTLLVQRASLVTERNKRRGPRQQGGQLVVFPPRGPVELDGPSAEE